MGNDPVASADTLEWVPEFSHSTGDTLVAYLPWHRDHFMPQPYYRVYPWKEGFSYERGKHPDLDDLSGTAATVDYAKHLCEQDYAKVARLHRWHEYMIANDPPA